MALPPTSHPWNIPVNIVPPTNGDTAPITPWKNLFFSPIGLYHLRRWLGVHPNHSNLFTANNTRFRSADLAWFASGTHKDGDHYRQPQMFHSSFVSLHQATARDQSLKEERKGVLAELQDLVFDTATLWDRASGGTTMIIHVNGTIMPGAPARPEYMKANVYLPPSLLHQHPALQQPLKHIIQTFIETVGIQTVEDWTAAARTHLRYSLAYAARSPLPNPSYTGFPQPQPGSAHYIFLGQPASLSASSNVITTPPSPPTITPPPSPTSESSLLYDLQDSYDLLEEKYATLLKEVKSLRLQKDWLNGMNAKLTAKLQEAQAQAFVRETPCSPSPKVLSQRPASQRVPPSPTSTRAPIPMDSPNVTHRTPRVKSPTPMSTIRPPFGSLPLPTPTVNSQGTQRLTEADPFNDNIYQYSSLASGSNSHRYGTATAPHPKAKAPTLRLLLQTLDLIHLEELIILIRDHVHADQHISRLMALDIPLELAQKITYFISPYAPFSSLDFE